MSSFSHKTLLSLALVVSVLRLGAAHGLIQDTIQVIDAPLLTQKIGTNRSIIVDASGDGEFTSIQAAIDSENKPYICMRGNGRGRTVVVWSQSSEDNIESATLRVEGKHFIAFGISFKVSNFGYLIKAESTSQNQSVAAFVGADKVAFYHCAFFSTHNTLFDYKGRHYYDDCYIQGSVDFIFGRATSIFHVSPMHWFELKTGRHSWLNIRTAGTDQLLTTEYPGRNNSVMKKQHLCYLLTSLMAKNGYQYGCEVSSRLKHRS